MKALSLLLAVPVMAALAAWPGAEPEPQKAPDPEVRALSAACTSLLNPQGVAALVKAAQTVRANTILLEVRRRGELCVDGGLEPRAAALASAPVSFDPLAATLSLAHARGIRVHASLSLSPVAATADLPASRAHLINEHPEWLMVPRAIARDLALLSPGSQLYLDRLLRWTRAQGDGVDGLYASPVPDDGVDALVAVAADLAARYAVDGIHLEAARYPNEDFDYARPALEAFKADILAGLGPEQRRQQERATGSDPWAWPEAFPHRWREFRRDRLTALVARVREGVRGRRPAAVFSASVVPDAQLASARHFQDWAEWLRRGAVDAVCADAHETDASAFEAKVAAARTAAGDAPVWAGIGAFKLSASETIENVRIARRLGARGFVICSYERLTGQPRALDYLAQVARAVFAP